MLENIKTKLSYNSDFLTTIIKNKDIEVLIAYCKDIANIEEFNKYYYPYININNLDEVISKFPLLTTKINTNITTITNELLTGHIIIMTELTQISILLPKNLTRNISNSVIDPVDLYSSQDGFVENLDTNIALIRKHLQNPNLSVETITLPTICNNKVAIISLNNQKYNKFIKEKLNSLNTKNVNSINTISKLFQNNHLVPMTLSTSSPQNISLSLEKGKTALLLGNTPVACIVPVNLLFFSTMKNDIDTPKYYSILSRLLVFLFLFTSVFLLGLYVAVTNFHSASLTIYAISNLKLTERGTTLPMLSEILIILLLFDLYRYATSRSSNGYIQNIIIFLGGLFIGQNAIKSGLIGHLVLLITSVSYLSTYAFTNNLHMVTSLSIFRIIILICSYLLGLYGFLFSSLIILSYLISIKSLDKDFFFSIKKNKLKDTIEYFIPKEPYETN